MKMLDFKEKSFKETREYLMQEKIDEGCLFIYSKDYERWHSNNYFYNLQASLWFMRDTQAKLPVSL